jgi:hypothetical protein
MPSIARRSVFLWPAVLALVAGGGWLAVVRWRGPAEPPWFTDVTAESGLDFVHDAGPTGSYFMPQVLGSGAALFDCDGDDKLDVFLLQGGGPEGSTNRLYRQEAGGHFRDISAGSGLDFAGYNLGVAIGDVNNDSRPDVLVTQYGGVRLLLNEGGGEFRDVTKAAGLDNPHWGTSAAFFDYDRDGWLDLVIVNYVDYDPSRVCAGQDGTPDFCFPKLFPGTVARLFHNLGPLTPNPSPPLRGRGEEEGKPLVPRRGERGRGEGAAADKPFAPLRGARGGGEGAVVRFEDVTQVSGLGAAPGPGLGVACADFDGDGWPDILVANDARPNHLWINRRDGTFAEEAVARGLACNALGQPQGNMGVALADVDGDGLFDVFITHLGRETHTLWGQGPRGQFSDRTSAAGLHKPRGTGFGTVLADFDRDGAPDLAIVNGRVRRGKGGGTFWDRYAERNHLFANDGGRFRDVSSDQDAFCATPGVFRGLACGDVDGDGALDLLVTEVGGRARLYRNVAPRRGHWLLVRAFDPRLHRDAYGAEIVVRANGKRWIGAINPGLSYLCSNDARAHFGLGGADRVEAIEVTWPDGLREEFAGRAADQAIELRHGEGKAVVSEGGS